MPHSPQIRINNVRAHHQQIQRSLAQLVQAPASEKSIQPLIKTLQQASEQIEQSCAQDGLTSAHLSDQSRQFLAWIKFLLDTQNLQGHLEAVRRVRQIAQSILQPKHKGFSHHNIASKSIASKSIASKGISAIHPQKITIEFSNLASLYRYKKTDDIALMQISEGFIAADDEVLRALAKAMIFGKSPETTTVLKRFAVSEEYSEVLLAMDLMVEPITAVAQGRTYDLDELFEGVNQQYFQGSLAKPKLAWSKMLTRRKFGHYEPARDRIVLSLTLDDHQVPSYVPEFVMYHEMLHILHGETWVNGRRMVHTPAFRQDERKFKHYASAETELSRLAQSRLP
ncbi:MAG: SprT-like domain-containing protein [Thermosynechococcaceae cyanobacterium MS004]|nr:SprT-like domain-containing protein [Thermosynechococcaceae cyanobacterium MS004]